MKKAGGRWLRVDGRGRTKEKCIMSLFLIPSPLWGQNAANCILLPNLGDSNVIHKLRVRVAKI